VATKARRNPGSAAKGGRRAPDPEHRQRDAERTKQALINAALVEFAAKGREGARVSEIAARAGVNKQLISYYFGGKDGLYEAIGERWLAAEARAAPPGIPLEDMIAAYLRLGGEHRDTVRLFVREGLDDPHGDKVRAPEPGEVLPEVADLQRRQAAGELADDLDPAFVLLMFMGLTVIDVTIAHQVKKFTGLDATSPEFRERYGEQLRRLIRHLVPKD
jgi:TetR/AcrR family transcriptional regulator